MLVEELDTYGCWDMTLPTVPERSYLYHLEPVGVGAPRVESICSYIIRLATAHGVTVEELIQGVILFEERSSSSLAKYRTHQKYELLIFQGSSLFPRFYPCKSALEHLRTIEKLTMRQNLLLLTMLPVGRLILLQEPFHYCHVWCPACLQDLRDSNNVVYEPLLWSLRVMWVCPHHQVRLQCRCPWCGMLSKFLEGTSRPGCCARCHNWLGIPLEHYKGIALDKKKLEWQTWIAETVGELLVVAPHINLLLDGSRITHLHQQLRNHVRRTAVSKTKRLREKRIDFEVLLLSCYHSRLSLLELITSEAGINQSELMTRSEKLALSDEHIETDGEIENRTSFFL